MVTGGRTEGDHRRRQRVLSIADSYDLADCETILDCTNHVIGHIRARNLETETRQAALLHSVLSGIRRVCELRRAHHCPVEFRFPEYPLHRGCIGHYPWKKQTAKKVGRRDDRILKQESHRLDYGPPYCSATHSVRECLSESLQ